MYSDKKIEETRKEMEERATEWDMSVIDVINIFIRFAEAKGNKESIEILEKILEEIKLEEQISIQEDEPIEEELQDEPTAEEVPEIPKESTYENVRSELKEDRSKLPDGKTELQDKVKEAIYDYRDYLDWDFEDQEEFFQTVENYTNGFEFLLDSLMTEATAGHRELRNDKYGKRLGKFIRYIHSKKELNGNQSEEKTIENLLAEYKKIYTEGELLETRILESRLKVIKEKDPWYR